VYGNEIIDNICIFQFPLTLYTKIVTLETRIINGDCGVN